MPAKIEQYAERFRTTTGEGVVLPRAQAPRITSNRYDTSELTARGADSLMAGARRLTSAYRAREEDDAKAWSAEVLSSARLEWTADLLRRQETAQPGAPDFVPTLMGDYDKYMEKVLESAPDDMSRKFLRDRLIGFRDDLGIRALTFEASARIDYRMDRFVQGADNVAKLMNTDPDQYQVALAEQLAIIDDAAIPPVQKSKMRQDVIDKVSTAATWSQIQKSPTAFLQSIGFGVPVDGKTRKSSGDLNGITGNTAFDALPFERRVQMFQQAITLKNQIDTDAERAVAAERKVMAEGAMKDAWDKFYSGKLRLDDIQRIKPLVSDNDYKSLREALKKGLGDGQKGPKTDPATFRELQQLLMTDPKAAQTFAFTAHRNGLLSNEHLSSALNSSRTRDRQEGPNSQYERSIDFIRNSLDPGPYVKDAVGKSRYAEAIDEFNRWINSGKRTDQEIDARGKEIVDQFRLVNLSDSVMALPVPRGTTIRRQANPQTLQVDILNASKSLQAQRDSGRLSPSEYAEEMKTLNRWRKAMEAAQKGAPSGK